MPRRFYEKEPLTLVGPQIEFAMPVPWEVFAFPPIAKILSAICLEAPEMVGGVVCITSTWRPAADPASWHHSGTAVDLRTGVDGATRRGAVVGLTRETRIENCRGWATRIKLRLGIDYDVIFGDPKHIDHIHIEHDGLKAIKPFRTMSTSTVV
jgi:hypothetical protein